LQDKRPAVGVIVPEGVGMPLRGIA